MAEAPTIPPEAMKILMKAPLRGKGASIYSIVSAQAGGVSDAVLRVLAGSKLDDFKGAIKTYLEWYDLLCEKTPQMTLTEVKEAVWNNIITDSKRLIDTWKAGLGLQMGTAFMGLEETYIGVPHLLSMYKVEQLDASLRPRLEQYWLSKYTPNIPSSQLAFQMYMEGQISKAEFGAYCLTEGWSAKWHDKLYDVYDREPDEYLAFSLFKRGLITEAEMKRCFKIRGYDEDWHSSLYEGLHRLPSFRELILLADYVPLTDLWVREVLRGNGMRETDLNYFAPAIQLRPLRDEVRSVIGRYLWEYQIGRIDRDTLKKNLQSLGVSPKELDLNMLWGDLRYADELLDEKLEILEERVLQGDPSLPDQATIKGAIVALGVLEEKANLMAELWYYKYIYAP